MSTTATKVAGFDCVLSSCAIVPELACEHVEHAVVEDHFLRDERHETTDDAIRRARRVLTAAENAAQRGGNGAGWRADRTGTLLNTLVHKMFHDHGDHLLSAQLLTRIIIVGDLAEELILNECRDKRLFMPADNLKYPPPGDILRTVDEVIDGLRHIVGWRLVLDHPDTAEQLGFTVAFKPQFGWDDRLTRFDAACGTAEHMLKVPRPG